MGRRGSIGFTGGTEFIVSEYESDTMGNAGEGPSITSPAIPPSVGSQVGGCDGMTASLWCDWREDDHGLFVDLLNDAQSRGKVSGRSECFEFRGHLVEVNPSGTRVGGGWAYVFKIAGYSFLMSRQAHAEKRQNMQVAFLGGVAMRHGWAGLVAWSEVLSILEVLGVRCVLRNTISRGDLFADCVGLAVSSFRRGRFVCRARFRSLFHAVAEEAVVEALRQASAAGLEAALDAVRRLWAEGDVHSVAAAVVACRDGEFDVAQYRSGDATSGYQFGRGKIVCRIYDKQLELQRKHPERVGGMLAAWGVTDQVPVTRVEFSLRSEALRSFGIVTVEDFCEKAAGVVEYLVSSWLVQYSRFDGHHPERCVVSGPWRRVRGFFASVFGGGQAAPRKVESEPSDAGQRLLRQGLGVIAEAVSRLSGCCDSAEDTRQTIINRLDEVAAEKGGWGAVFADNCRRAVRFSNRVGGLAIDAFSLPTSARQRAALIADTWAFADVAGVT